MSLNKIKSLNETSDLKNKKKKLSKIKIDTSI